MAEEQKVVVAPIVVPAVTPEEAIKAWKQYTDLKAKIVTKDDVQKIQNKDFLKKSYWRKIATFFNLSLECVEEHRQDGLEPNTFSYLLTYKAIAPNNRFAYGDGACSSWEKGLDKTEHNTRAIAHTRAFNRAVSNLVGGGEVSAEEVMPAPYKEAPKKEEPTSQKPGQITKTDCIKKARVFADAIGDDIYCQILANHSYTKFEDIPTIKEMIDVLKIMKTEATARLENV